MSAVPFSAQLLFKPVDSYVHFIYIKISDNLDTYSRDSGSAQFESALSGQPFFASETCLPLIYKAKSKGLVKKKANRYGIKQVPHCTLKEACPRNGSEGYIDF